MTDENGKKRPPTRGERAVSWAKALSILVATGIAVYAAVFKGEPEADKAKARVDQTWKEMKREVRKLKQAYDKLHLRVVYFQAREEGATSGALQAKLDQLQMKYDALALASKKRTRRDDPQVEILKGVTVEQRRLRKKLEGLKRATKAVKAVKPMVQKHAPPAAPPWSK